MGSRVLFGPEVTSEAELVDLARRIFYYFDGLVPECVTILVGHDLGLDRVDRCLDKALVGGWPFRDQIARDVDALRGSLEFVVYSESAATSSATNTDFFAVWNADFKEVEPWPLIWGSHAAAESAFVVDWKRTRFDGAAFVNLASLIAGGGNSWEQESDAAFRHLLRACSGAARVLLVATGPSVQHVSSFEKSASDVAVVCDTAVMDEDLMAELRPEIVMFADPVFHFGPSAYVEKFHEAVLDVAESYGSFILTGQRYAKWLARRLPELNGRIIGLRRVANNPGQPKAFQNFNLVDEPAVVGFPNVLTMLMFPMAATLSRHLVLYGFDGQNPTDDGYRHHGDKAPLADYMPAVREVHPGLFDVDLPSYYSNHIENVNIMVNRLEDQGNFIEVATPSHIPALNLRQSNEPTVADQSRPSESFHATSIADSARLPSAKYARQIYSICPLYGLSYGHYRGWEQTVSRVAVRNGYRYTTLANNAAVAVDGVHSVFSGDLWHSLSNRQFEKELRKALMSDDGNRRVGYVLFYAADVKQAAAIKRVAGDYPGLTFVTNFLLSNAQLASDRAAVNSLPGQQLLLALSDTASTNTVWCLDNEFLLRKVERKYPALVGRFKEWPMVGVLTGQDSRTPESPSNSERLRLYAPGKWFGFRGFEEVIRLAERIAEDKSEPGIEIVVSQNKSSAENILSSDAINHICKRMEGAGATLIYEEISDERYLQLLRSSDVLWLPYSPNPFRYRTSGMFVDAAITGIPVVCPRNTWMADQIDKFGVGVTYREGDLESLQQALRAIMSNRSSFAQSSANQAAAMEQRFSPRNILGFLENLSLPTRQGTDQSGLSQMATVARQAREELEYSLARSEMSRLVSLAVSDDPHRQKVNSPQSVPQR